MRLLGNHVGQKYLLPGRVSGMSFGARNEGEVRDGSTVMHSTRTTEQPLDQRFLGASGDLSAPLIQVLTSNLTWIHEPSPDNLSAVV